MTKWNKNWVFFVSNGMKRDEFEMIEMTLDTENASKSNIFHTLDVADFVSATVAWLKTGYKTVLSDDEFRRITGVSELTGDGEYEVINDEGVVTIKVHTKGDKAKIHAWTFESFTEHEYTIVDDGMNKVKMIDMNGKTILIGTKVGVDYNFFKDDLFAFVLALGYDIRRAAMCGT